MSANNDNEVRLRPVSTSNYGDRDSMVVTAAPQVRAEETLQRVASIKRRPLQVIDTRSDVRDGSTYHPDIDYLSQDYEVENDTQQSQPISDRLSSTDSGGVAQSPIRGEQNEQDRELKEKSLLEEKRGKLQSFTRRRYLLSLVLGILIRLSFLSDLGEAYVQVSKLFILLFCLAITCISPIVIVYFN